MQRIRHSLWLSTSLLAATMFCAAPAWAGDIVGNVADATQTRALQGAQIRILELDRVAEAARDGSFRFTDVPAGTYTIEARYSGAEPSG
jgi:hypothetical protein